MKWQFYYIEESSANIQVIPQSSTIASPSASVSQLDKASCLPGNQAHLHLAPGRSSLK